MLQGTPDSRKIRSALLCVEPSLDTTGNPVPLAQIYGKPVLFHQIKQLERLGVTDIVVAVDTVPADLPKLIDRLNDGNVSVRLMRQISDPSNSPEFDDAFLLVGSGLWIADKLLADALAWDCNSIAVLPEDPANGEFERIDLSRRWAGYATFDKAALAHCAKMPEGWSLDSFLLRHALQTGARDVAIDQSSVTGRALHKISASDDLEMVATNLIVLDEDGGKIEALLANVSSRWIYRLAAQPWLVAAFAWGPPVLALGSIVSSYFGYVSGALLVLVLALGLDVVRRQLRLVEYRSAGIDAVQVTIYGALAVSVTLSFIDAGADVGDGLFLACMMFGLLLLGRLASESRATGIISPLSIGLLLLLVSILMPFLTGTKIIIAGMLAVLLCARWVSGRKLARLNSN